MRRDTVQIVRQAVSEDRRAYVLVNNRSEGNAPLTVQGLSEMLRKQRPGSFRSRAFTSYRGGCHPVTRSEASSLYYAPGTVHMSTNTSIVQEDLVPRIVAVHTKLVDYPPLPRRHMNGSDLPPFVAPREPAHRCRRLP